MGLAIALSSLVLFKWCTPWERKWNKTDTIFSASNSYMQILSSLWPKRKTLLCIWVYAHAEAKGTPRMSSMALYPSLLRQALSLHRELTVFSAKLVGLPSASSVFVSSTHCPVTEAHCGHAWLLYTETGSRVQVPRLMHTCLPANPSLWLHSLLHIFFFCNVNLSMTDLLQIVSISLHLDGVVFSSSQVLCLIWKKLHFKLGQNDASLCVAYTVLY